MAIVYNPLKLQLQLHLQRHQLKNRTSLLVETQVQVVFYHSQSEKCHS